jgi:cobalt-zinc-cadmium efflux system outer membrane protein
MNSFSYLALVICFLGAHLSFAESKNPECSITNYSELVKCIEKTALPVQIADQNLKASRHLEDASRQWINPEIDAETVSKGSEKSETTATLFFNFRLGGKRSSGIKEALGEIAKSEAERDQIVQQTRLDFMLALYRLTQLKSEISIEQESVETFSKIVGQFEKRPALNPEQNVSLAVFKMALGDHSLRLASLKNQEEKLYQSLTAATGIRRDLIQKNLPLKKQSWPDLSKAKDDQILSPKERKALAELKIAEGLKEKADAGAWPNLKVGPTVRSTKDNGVSDSFVGFSLSMPLPVFTLNGGSRSFAEQKKLAAAMSLEHTKRLELSSRAQLVSQYYQTVSALKNTISLKVIDEKHEQIEKQFFRGLVPSSLVIEAHRQLLDLEERRNLSELEALEALGQILIIDNKFQEVIL